MFKNFILKSIRMSKKSEHEFYLDRFDPALIRETLDKWGVVVIKSHFSDTQVDQWFLQIKNWLKSISPGLTDDEKTWIEKNLPYGPRRGMMQSLISHCPTVWNIREAFYPLYSQILQDEKLYTSIDGATMHPYIPTDKKDWPHIDQTVVVWPD